MLQANLVVTHDSGWGIDWFFHFLIMMCLHSYKQLFTLGFFPLDKNQSQILKTMILHILKKIAHFCLV